MGITIMNKVTIIFFGLALFVALSDVSSSGGGTVSRHVRNAEVVGKNKEEKKGLRGGKRKGRKKGKKSGKGLNVQKKKINNNGKRKKGKRMGENMKKRKGIKKSKKLGIRNKSKGRKK